MPIGHRNQRLTSATLGLPVGCRVARQFLLGLAGHFFKGDVMPTRERAELRDLQQAAQDMVGPLRKRMGEDKGFIIITCHRKEDTQFHIESDFSPEVVRDFLLRVCKSPKILTHVEGHTLTAGMVVDPHGKSGEGDGS
jgi:hypothetical protein